MSDERRSEILAIIDRKGEASLAELCGLFPDVSEMTVRRDLIQLEQDGRIIRTRGGAVSVRNLRDSGAGYGQNGEENEYLLRANTNRDAKDIIARKALAFVEKGRSIYFDAGSTVMALARVMPDETMTIRIMADELDVLQYRVGMEAEILVDAQVHPEDHKDLLVRVAGYTAFFVELGKDIQNDIIQRTEIKKWA